MALDAHLQQGADDQPCLGCSQGVHVDAEVAKPVDVGDGGVEMPMKLSQMRTTLSYPAE